MDLQEKHENDIKLMNENARIQKEANINSFKRESKNNALRAAPHSKSNPAHSLSIGSMPITATEIVSEAEIIYQWLIKDIQ